MPDVFNLGVQDISGVPEGSQVSRPTKLALRSEQSLMTTVVLQGALFASVQISYASEQMNGGFQV